MQGDQDTYYLEDIFHDSKIHTVDYVGTPSKPMVQTSETTFNGKPVEVSCSVCHTTREPNVQNRRGEDLDLFHQGLTVQHGTLSCLSCHNSENYDTLRLADGSSVAYEQSMQLCAQCHGPQYRDYQHGSHGGMNGYWDLSRGGRTRNTCNVCHDPHAPAYPQLKPVFAPKDVPVRQSHSESEHPTPSR